MNAQKTALLTAMIVFLSPLVVLGEASLSADSRQIEIPPAFSASPPAGDRIDLINDGSFEFGPCDGGSAWTCDGNFSSFSWILDPTSAWGFPAYDGVLVAWLGGYMGGDPNINSFCQDIFFDGTYLDWYWMGYVAANCATMEVRVDGSLVYEHAMEMADHTYGTWNAASTTIAAPFGVNVGGYLGGLHELCFEWNCDACSPAENDNMLIDYVMLTEPMEALIEADGSGDYPTIQEGLDAVADGGTVYLGDGVFEGPGNYHLYFGPKSLHLRSLSLNPETCIIQPHSVPRPMGPPRRRGVAAREQNDREVPAYNGIVFDSCCASGSQVSGITFQNCEGWINNTGGAIRAENNSPSVSDCIFRECVAEFEGGAVELLNSAAQFVNCRFEHNLSTFGGAVCVGGEFSSPIFENCSFSYNNATWSGAFDVYSEAHATVRDCVFFSNHADDSGGALSLYENESMDIQSCTFSENSSPLGGAIHARTPFLFWFNIIAFSGDGGSIAYSTSPPEPRGLPDIACCDFFGNVGGDWPGDLSGLLGIGGNFSEDPQFCGMIGTGNFDLQSDSPCVSVNNDCGVLIGAMPENCGESAARISTWSEVKALY